MPVIVAVTALLMLLACALSQQPADVPLPPPTNVMVNCTDTQGTVHWQYGEEANVHFRVEVGNPKSDYKRHATKEHFYKNITARVWESLESAMDVYYVSVTAVVPDRPLFPPISTTFTYNRVKMADVKCKLAFPDVDVKADNGSTVVSFRNPLHHDPQLRHATRGAATLKFIAAYDSGAVEENSCHPHQNVCRANVTFPPGSSECVTLTGWVSYSGGGGLEFGPSRRACRERSSGWATLPVVLPSVLVPLLICVVVAVVAWRRMAKAPKEPLSPQVSGCCKNGIQSCFARSSRQLQVQYSPQSEGPAHLSEGARFFDSPLPQEEEVQEVEQEKQKVEEEKEGKGCWGSNDDHVHENIGVSGQVGGRVHVPYTEVRGKPVCLLCGGNAAVMKELNLRRHYQTSKKHTDQDKNMEYEQKLQKVEELKRGLKSRQAMFTYAKSQSEAAAKASFIVAKQIAKSARPFAEGELIKNGF